LKTEGKRAHRLAENLRRHTQKADKKYMEFVNSAVFLKKVLDRRKIFNSQVNDESSVAFGKHY
jgi:hypothetical protein